MAPAWPNIAPAWPQNGPRRPNRAPTYFQHVPNMPSTSPSMAHRWLLGSTIEFAMFTRTFRLFWAYHLSKEVNLVFEHGFNTASTGHSWPQHSQQRTPLLFHLPLASDVGKYRLSSVSLYYSPPPKGKDGCYPNHHLPHTDPPQTTTPPPMHEAQHGST